MHSIFLLGYMGCGKSTLGKKLSQQLDLPFFDLDKFIEEQEGCSVADLFSAKGEIYFRKVERKALDHFIENDRPFIVALGGGTPCYFNNMESLLSSAHKTLYFKANIPTLSSRLEVGKETRPMISHLKTMDQLNEFIGKHLFERAPFYQQAEIIVTVDGKSVEEIVQEAVKVLA